MPQAPSSTRPARATGAAESGPPRGRLRSMLTALAVLVLAAAAVLAGAVLLRPSGPDPAAAGTRYGTPALLSTSRVDGVPAGSAAALAANIAAAQRRLARLPGDWATWAELGVAYVQQARLTADPSYYPKAEGAVRKSFEVQPKGNFLALIGQGALAAARHDFPAALSAGQRAAAIDPYSAAAQGVITDALIELGRYDEAWVAVQRMVDLRPDTGSLARASYAAELRGDVARARELLTDALQLAPSPVDAGFACYYLGELAWNNNDLAAAAGWYDEGLRRAPEYLPLLSGRARAAAAQGRYAAAVADYRTLVARQPQPSYLIEYGDLLAAHGDKAGAAAQYAVVRTEEKLFAAQGVNVDLELALFDADHGQPTRALAEANAEYAVRRPVSVEDGLAWALHAAGRDTDALPHARAAVRLGTHSAQFRYHLGMIEAAVGDKAGARRDLAEALKLNPHFSPVQAPIARDTLRMLGGVR
ncbi:MAG TPA: tetratricopeptide repeat protein [Mycobacteriales bacterium]|nr:tetratricopeptide repeat protein [Mycobacteriales bacterium]